MIKGELLLPFVLFESCHFWMMVQRVPVENLFFGFLVICPVKITSTFLITELSEWTIYSFKATRRIDLN